MLFFTLLGLRAILPPRSVSLMSSDAPRRCSRVPSSERKEKKEYVVTQLSCMKKKRSGNVMWPHCTAQQGRHAESIITKHCVFFFF